MYYNIFGRQEQQVKGILVACTSSHRNCRYILPPKYTHQNFLPIRIELKVKVNVGVERAEATVAETEVAMVAAMMSTVVWPLPP